ncbi:hypothetical protein GCM10010185_51020 [Saccharothrix coeruleofusca]|uniref:Peptidase inhibitor family I36 n=1 Tax=Saccharothrix coeruleofusca TaxID=33919 RepID=A0A918AR58_9PSEU|nr:hypothetical protein GCM10010185_51020 [Saccharothrix coeruleofusca]
MLVKVGSALSGAVIALGVLTAPANAEATWDRCPHGSYCLFEHRDGGGALYRVSNPNGNTRVNLPGWFNDKASAVWNRSGQLMGLYKDANCKAPLVKAGPYGNPEKLGAHTQDRASSICGLA